MIPVTPQLLHNGGQLVVFAENQTVDYIPLAASVDSNGTVMTEWEPTDEERAILQAGGRIRLWIWTFNRPLQPVSVEAVPVTSSILV